MSKEGTCIEIIKNKEITAVSYYKDIKNPIDVLKVLKNIIKIYNEKGLNNYKDPLLLSIRLLECDRLGTNNKWFANLTEESYAEAEGLYPHEKFYNPEDFFGPGKIGITTKDITDMIMNSMKTIIIDLDNKKIRFNNYYIVAIEKDIFESNFPEVNISKLDVFEYNMLLFNFYDIEDIIDFHKNHDPAEKDKYKKYFLLKGVEDKIFNLA